MFQFIISQLKISPIITRCALLQLNNPDNEMKMTISILMCFFRFTDCLRFLFPVDQVKDENENEMMFFLYESATMRSYRFSRTYTLSFRDEYIFCKGREWFKNIVVTLSVEIDGSSRGNLFFSGQSIWYS